METCSSRAEGRSRAPACPHTGCVARASQPASRHYAPSVWLSLSSSVEGAGFACQSSCSWVSPECPHKAKFLISVNSEIASISLASDEMYNSASGHVPNCKGLQVSLFLRASLVRPHQSVSRGAFAASRSETLRLVSPSRRHQQTCTINNRLPLSLNEICQPLESKLCRCFFLSVAFPFYTSAHGEW